MTDQEIFEQLKAILVTEFGADADAVESDATLTAALGLDSLELLILAEQAERRFGVRLAVHDVTPESTVGELVVVVRRCVGSSPAANGIGAAAKGTGDVWRSQPDADAGSLS